MKIRTAGARRRRWAGIALAVAVAAAGSVSWAIPEASAGPETIACTGDPDNVRPLALTVEGQQARGLYAVPDSAPRGLVVFFHGYTETMQSWSDHITRVANDDQVIAVAMNYRGLLPGPSDDEFPGSTGMPFVAGAQDGVAAARAFDAACPGLEHIVAYGNSMGGGIAGLAVATAQRRADGNPLFDHLVATAGFSNLVEGWSELTAGSVTQQTFFTQGKADLERETGGTPATVPGAYQDRSSALRAGDIAASGVAGVTLVHGIADGTVPVDQSIEMALALTTVGVPVDIILAGGRPDGTAAGSTLDGTVLGLLGMPSTDSPLAGHPSDPDPFNVVAATGFTRLSGIFAGDSATPCLRVGFVDLATAGEALSEGVCTASSQLRQVIAPVGAILAPLSKALFAALPR